MRSHFVRFRARKASLALAKLLAAACVALSPALHAEEMRRLSGSAIPAALVGRTLTDESHWSDRFLPGGRLESVDLGVAKTDRWKLEGDELCITRRRRRESTRDCFEVWRTRDRVEFRRDGVTVVEGVLRDK